MLSSRGSIRTVSRASPALPSSPTASREFGRAGNPMADLDVRPPESPSTLYQPDLPLAGFAAGESLIEIKATGAGGDARALVPLKITR